MAHTLVSATCLHCGKSFELYESRVRQGNGKYCSQACFHAHRKGKPRALGVRPPPEEKTCPVCGKTFMVGGRYSKRERRFCSWTCGGLGTQKQPDVQSATLSVADAAYLAGIIDGEGQVALRRIPATDGVYVEIIVTNSYLPILEWIRATTGVGNIRVHRPEGYKGHAWKQTWTWLCASIKATSVLAQIRPYMHIKAERADLALETQDRLMDAHLRGDRTWQVEYFQRMKELNRQGSPSFSDAPRSFLEENKTVLRGEDAPMAKLTEDAVRAIRAEHDLGQTTIKALASRHGVCSGTIALIVKRKNWKHVT